MEATDGLSLILVTPVWSPQDAESIHLSEAKSFNLPLNLLQVRIASNKENRIPGFQPLKKFRICHGPKGSPQHNSFSIGRTRLIFKQRQRAQNLAGLGLTMLSQNAFTRM